MYNNNLKSRSPKNEENRLQSPSSRLDNLSPELKKIREEDPKFFRKMVNLFSEDRIRFANYLKNKKKVGIEIAKNAAIWNDQNVDDLTFRDDSELIASFSSWGDLVRDVHMDDFGRYGSFPVKDEEDVYLEVIKDIVRSIDTKRVMWASSCLSWVIRPRFGYVYQKDGKMTLIVIDDEGYIERVGVGIPWIEVVREMNSFYKIDFFEE